MVIIEIRFTAGRYHATHWERNVVEGEAEWPPSPYRIARAMIDVCHRRKPDWDDSRMVAAIRPLQAPASFYLPTAFPKCTWSYLHSNEKDPTKKQKIPDSFVVIDRNAPVFATFDTDISDDARRDLICLLQELGYLGRAESWVSAGLCEDIPTGFFTCIPHKGGGDLKNNSIVRVACVLPEEEYVKTHPQSAHTWLGAMSLSTDDLLKVGWSDPPAQKMIDYLLPLEAITPRRTTQHQRVNRFRMARYALSSTVLPRVTETVPFAERIRIKLMGIHRRICGGDLSAVSPLFSGKSKDGKPATGHAHAFILPVDQDGDGKIDHVLIKAKAGFNQSEIAALDRLNSVWQSDGKPDVQMVLNSLSDDKQGSSAKRFRSSTPFVTNRHPKGDHGAWLNQEIRRECGHHGIPEPISITWIDRTQGTAHPIRWWEFTRSRKGDSNLNGWGCVLEFKDEVKGPFAIGALSHFGLGLFVPEKEDCS
ncbi:MAG: type I-U CRISPR-associated protein Cas5/Cas6 [Deltaproteobacteria bacterium]